MGACALVLLLAPIVVREPVGQGNWEKRTDPVQHRVAGLLVGAPVSAGAATIVPLHARVPSEAGHGQVPETLWHTDGVGGRIVHEDGRYYLRVINPTDHAVLVPAGTVFSLDGREVYVERDGVVPRNFAALFPARVRKSTGAPGAASGLRWQGILPPSLTGLLIRGGAEFDGAARWSRFNGAQTYVRVLATRAVARKHAALRHRSAAMADAGGTTVGAVFLIGDRPVAAHIFATHEMYAAALPDLLMGVAAQAREWELIAGVKEAVGPRSARGRALQFLRSVLPVRGRWSESYGAGFEVVLDGKRLGFVGHAIVDVRRTVLHASYFAVGTVLPGAPGAGTGAPSSPPDDGKSETPPGVAERKPRPTVAEQRRRDRHKKPR